MKIKYTVKPIYIDLSKERLNVLISTEKEKEEFIELAEKLGYTKGTAKYVLPKRLFIGGAESKMISHGDVKYNYKGQSNLLNRNYKEIELEKLKEIVNNGWIKKEE